MENSRNKQFLSFKLRAIPSGAMKFCVAARFPAWDVSPSLASASALGAPPAREPIEEELSGFRLTAPGSQCLCPITLFYLITAQSRSHNLYCSVVLHRSVLLLSLVMSYCARFTR